MKRLRVGIFDGMHGATGGAQLVAAYLATAFSQRCEVSLIHDGTTGTLESMRRTFGLPLAAVTERQLQRLPTFAKPDLRSIGRELTGSASELSRQYDLFIYSGFRVPPFCRARRGLVYCHFPFQQKLSHEAKERRSGRRAGLLKRFLSGIAYPALWHYRFRGYDRVLANSAFTASWIKRRWGVDAEVLFPPVGTTLPERLKRNVIVTVGKFAGDPQHSKKQLEQVSAFRDFLATPGKGWRLRMIGFCDSPSARVYIESVRRAARDLPVEIVEGATRAEVLESLAEAKVYWHTMGLGSDESSYPERAEHFGIATVEAMRAGCVPVVIASGGQREIVEQGESGFLCSDLGEMVAATQSLVQNPDRFAKMSERARQRSFQFSPQQFFSRLSAITSEFFPEAISLDMVENADQASVFRQ